jgi:hypothetical protein
MKEDQTISSTARLGGNRARVRRYRSLHRRIDYVPSPDVLPIIQHHLKIGNDPCLAGLIITSYVWASGHYRKWGYIMGRRRGFLPPAICEACKSPPALGESLWPGDMWCCFSCLEKSLPGEDCTSKSMHKMLEYGRESRDSFELESKGKNAEEPRNRAEWA